MVKIARLEIPALHPHHDNLRQTAFFCEDGYLAYKNHLVELGYKKQLEAKTYLAKRR